MTKSVIYTIWGGKSSKNLLGSGKVSLTEKQPVIHFAVIVKIHILQQTSKSRGNSLACFQIGVLWILCMFPSLDICSCTILGVLNGLLYCCVRMLVLSSISVNLWISLTFFKMLKCTYFIYCIKIFFFWFMWENGLQWWQYTENNYQIFKK